MSRTTRKPAIFCKTEPSHIIRELNNQYRLRLSLLRYPTAKWIAKAIKTDEQVIAEAKKQYARWQRDGRDGLTHTKNNSGFKKDAKLITRRGNKRLCAAIVRGADYDDDTMIFPIRKNEKTRIWSWW